MSRPDPWPDGFGGYGPGPLDEQVTPSGKAECVPTRSVAPGPQIGKEAYGQMMIVRHSCGGAVGGRGLAAAAGGPVRIRTLI